MSKRVWVSEIYKTIQGESTRTGIPCVMVRLAGCDAGCNWCDTPQAQTTDGAGKMSIEDILAKVQSFKCRLVEVTGGEPLQQDVTPDLLAALCNAGYQTLLETNGLNDISAVDSRVVKIIDIKCPSSGVQDQTLWDNISLLNERDELKFVIANGFDYKYARDKIREMNLSEKCSLIMSPVHQQINLKDLASWILEDGLDVRMGIQLHKIIWPEGESVE